MVSDAALEDLSNISVIEEPDTVANAEDLSKSIDGFASRKIPGKNRIPPEVLKSGKSALLWHLHELLCLFWVKGYIPHDMYEANIITLYKNKGDHSDCSNYCPF